METTQNDNTLNATNLVHDLRTNLSMTTLLLDKILVNDKFIELRDSLNKAKYNIYSSIEIATDMLVTSRSFLFTRLYLYLWQYWFIY